MFKLLKQLKKREWLFALCSVVFIVAQVWLDLKMPEYMNRITQISQGAVNTETGQPYVLSDIWANGGSMLLCALASMLCSIITSFFVVSVAANFSARLRERLYTKVQSFSMSEINRFSTASLITRSTNDVQQVQMLLTMGLQMMIKAPITAVWAILKIAGKEWQWSAAVAVAVAVLLTGIVVIMLLVVRKFRIMQRLTDDLNRVTRENLTGIRVIRAYNAERFQQDKFEKVNGEFMRTNLYTGRIMAFMNPLMSMVMNGISLAIYWIGAFLINRAPLMEVPALFGDMVVFMSYGMQIISSFMMLAMMFMIAPRALVSANRINEVLDTKELITEGQGVGETRERGTVEFRDVSFRYPDGQQNVLNHISFRVKKGQTIAFIGATGCGKSTVVNLVSRFYDATEGQVLVDGHDVREYSKKELARKIGYVSQKAVLFSGDIRSNVDFGDNNSDEETVREAIDIAQSSDFVEAQEDGIAGHVAQNGSNFSGGQKQRLSIARAVARRAEIYIFDDTFSALDYQTDRALRKALREKMSDSTCLIVAQRIGTILDADQIVVLENGEVVGHGTHGELLQCCETYREIARSQLSEEELKHAQTRNE
ncbi:MAG: ABC transporter ATP-binding protein/permease [Oscillospiraceae bacterium]|nr:ABC transporter ATP-binding protein/permease [Oscillospiraceae bacterium]